MKEYQAIRMPSKPFDIFFKVLLLCLIICPLMALIYASIIRGVAVYFFIGAVIIIPWIAAFFGYCIGYVTHVFFQRSESIQQSNNISYLIALALVITFYTQWLIWTFYVVQGHVSTNPEIIQMQTYSYINQMYTLVTDPNLLIDLLKEINEVGTWSIDDDVDLMLGRTKGLALTVFWVVEFMLMGLFAFFVDIKHRKKAQ